MLSVVGVSPALLVLAPCLGEARIVSARGESEQYCSLNVPAATTISAIAERAGVQRLTVYRYFPDERALLGACSSDWNAQHPLPEPAVWAGL